MTVVSNVFIYSPLSTDTFELVDDAVKRMTIFGTTISDGGGWWARKVAEIKSRSPARNCVEHRSSYDEVTVPTEMFVRPVTLTATARYIPPTNRNPRKPRTAGVVRILVAFSVRNGRPAKTTAKTHCLAGVPSKFPA